VPAKSDDDPSHDGGQCHIESGDNLMLVRLLQRDQPVECFVQAVPVFEEEKQRKNHHEKRHDEIEGVLRQIADLG